jgi:hypothetical protein
MFDSQLGYFLFLLFFFWVLESVGKAMQRRRNPGQMPPEGETLSTPRTDAPDRQQMELPAPRTQPQRVPSPPQRPRNLWEEIAEIARQQAEQQGLPGPSAPQAPPRREVPTTPPQRPKSTSRRAQRLSDYSPPTPAHGHQASGRWEQGAERETAARAEAEGAASDERRSDRWLTGARGEGAAPDGAAAEASGPGEASRYEETDAARRRADQLKRPAAAPVSRTSAALPATRKKSDVVVMGAAALAAARQRDRPAAAAAVAQAARVSELDLHNLRGASRGELRRLLLLSEVLGPPLALREGQHPEE